MGRMGTGLGLAIVLLATTSGCRCFPGFNCYANVIDGVGDFDILWDQWYNPRLDISRAGRPDWCGPINAKLAPCRCEGTPCWDRADECWLYPARHPYWYPDRTMANFHQPRVAKPTAGSVPSGPDETGAPLPAAPNPDVLPPGENAAPPSPSGGKTAPPEPSAEDAAPALLPER